MGDRGGVVRGRRSLGDSQSMTPHHRSFQHPGSANASSHPHRRFHQRITDHGNRTLDTVDAFSLGSELARDCSSSLLRFGSAFVLRRSGFADQLVNRWQAGFATLRTKLSHADVGFDVSNASLARFYNFDVRVNVRSSIYHVREPENWRVSGTFADFHDCCERWQQHSPFFCNTIIGSNAQPKLSESEAASDAFHAIRWSNLLDMIGELSTDLLRVDLHAGRSGSMLPAFQHIANATLIFQICGQRRVLAIPPQYSYSGLYAFPVQHPYDGHSMVDLESLDLAKWPKAHTIQGYEAILQPGDVLVVPAFWWIQQEELSKETVALQSLCQRRGLDAVAHLSPQQAEVRAGRAVESLVSQSDAVGANKAKGFFQGILAGDLAASTIDRFTLEGYQTVQLLQLLHDIADGYLCRIGALKDLLERMIDRRLDPTAWLNSSENMRDKELARDVEKQELIEDDRTDAEIDFPELFAPQLELRGYQSHRSESEQLPAKLYSRRRKLQAPSHKQLLTNRSEKRDEDAPADEEESKQQS